MGWGSWGQWRQEWTCYQCNCKGNSYNRSTCRRCKAVWWSYKEIVLEDNQGEVASRAQAKGKGGVPKVPPTQKPKQDKKEVLTNCLLCLGDMDEMEDLRDVLQNKVNQIQGEDFAKEQEKELKAAKELSKLMERQSSLQKAITSLKDFQDCGHMVTDMEAKLEQLEKEIKEKTKKPAEERIRSLQDKKAHKVKIQEKLNKELQTARQALEDLQEKDKENKKELSSIQAELSKAMEEIQHSMSKMEVESEGEDGERGKGPTAGLGSPPPPNVKPEKKGTLGVAQQQKGALGATHGTHSGGNKDQPSGPGIPTAPEDQDQEDPGKGPGDPGAKGLEGLGEDGDPEGAIRKPKGTRPAPY